eukprot:5671939-Amphidinium_carterae.1
MGMQFYSNFCCSIVVSVSPATISFSSAFPVYINAHSKIMHRMGCQSQTKPSKKCHRTTIPPKLRGAEPHAVTLAQVVQSCGVAALQARMRSIWCVPPASCHCCCYCYYHNLGNLPPIPAPTRKTHRHHMPHVFFRAKSSVASAGFRGGGVGLGALLSKRIRKTICYAKLHPNQSQNPDRNFALSCWNALLMGHL